MTQEQRPEGQIEQIAADAAPPVPTTVVEGPAVALGAPVAGRIEPYFTDEGELAQRAVTNKPADPVYRDWKNILPASLRTALAAKAPGGEADERAILRWAVAPVTRYAVAAYEGGREEFPRATKFVDDSVAGARTFLSDMITGLKDIRTGAWRNNRDALPESTAKPEAVEVVEPASVRYAPRNYVDVLDATGAIVEREVSERRAAHAEARIQTTLAAGFSRESRIVLDENQALTAQVSALTNEVGTLRERSAEDQAALSLARTVADDLRTLLAASTAREKEGLAREAAHKAQQLGHAAVVEDLISQRDSANQRLVGAHMAIDVEQHINVQQQAEVDNARFDHAKAIARIEVLETTLGQRDAELALAYADKAAQAQTLNDHGITISAQAQTIQRHVDEEARLTGEISAARGSNRQLSMTVGEQESRIGSLTAQLADANTLALTRGVENTRRADEAATNSTSSAALREIMTGVEAMLDAALDEFADILPVDNSVERRFTDGTIAQPLPFYEAASPGVAVEKAVVVTHDAPDASAALAVTTATVAPQATAADKTANGGGNGTPKIEPGKPINVGGNGRVTQGRFIKASDAGAANVVSATPSVESSPTLSRVMKRVSSAASSLGPLVGRSKADVPPAKEAAMPTAVKAGDICMTTNSSTKYNKGQLFRVTSATPSSASGCFVKLKEISTGRIVTDRDIEDMLTAKYELVFSWTGSKIHTMKTAREDFVPLAGETPEQFIQRFGIDLITPKVAPRTAPAGPKGTDEPA